MSDADVSTERVRAAATGADNIPVTPEQFDRWLERIRDEAWSDAVID